jgi:hypothetical protein
LSPVSERNASLQARHLAANVNVSQVRFGNGARKKAALPRNRLTSAQISLAEKIPIRHCTTINFSQYATSKTGEVWLFRHRVLYTKSRLLHCSRAIGSAIISNMK